MVLISIHPFAFRKVFLILAALLCFSAFCFADPVFMAQQYLPAKGAGETFPTPQLTGHAEFAPLPPVDFPSRNQRLLPCLERGDESLGQDITTNPRQETA